MNLMQLLRQNSLYSRIIDVFLVAESSFNCNIYLVGGAVRDLVVTNASDTHPSADFNDLDFVVIGGNYELVARYVAKSLSVPSVPFKDNMRLMLNTTVVDVSAPRGATIESDLLKRDFTINNLALSLGGKLIGDPSDIISKTIRPVYDGLFDDDPLRILRGFRQAATLGYTLSERFLTIATPKVPLIANVASERVQEELHKLSSADYNHNIVTQMNDIGVFNIILKFTPDIHHMPSIMSPTLSDTSGDVRFGLFLSGLLECQLSSRKATLKRLMVSNNIASITDTLLSTADVMERINQQGKQAIVWKYRETLPIILHYAMAVDKLSQECYDQYIQLLNSGDFAKADLINGEMVIGRAKELLGSIGQGRWIADILTDIKLKLIFDKEFKQADIEGYLDKKIRELEF